MLHLPILPNNNSLGIQVVCFEVFVSDIFFPLSVKSVSIETLLFPVCRCML